MKCWCGYLSETRCRLFAYGPLHPKTPPSVASLKSRLVLPLWYQLTQVVMEKRRLNWCRSSVVIPRWYNRSNPKHTSSIHRPSSVTGQPYTSRSYRCPCSPSTHTHPFNGPFPGLPRWASTRKVKPIWILLKQETVSAIVTSWAIHKSAPRFRQITMPAPPPLSFLQAGCPSCRPTKQHQRTEGTFSYNTRCLILVFHHKTQKQLTSHSSHCTFVSRLVSSILQRFFPRWIHQADLARDTRLQPDTEVGYL